MPAQKWKAERGDQEQYAKLLVRRCHCDLSYDVVEDGQRLLGSSKGTSPAPILDHRDFVEVEKNYCTSLLDFM